MPEPLPEMDNAWWVTVLAGAISVLIVVTALGIRRRPRGSAGQAATLDADLRATIDELEELAQRLQGLIDEADSRIEAMREVGTESQSSAGDPLAKQVYALADTGHTPVEIARQLDEHTGKIELILALRDQTLES